MPITCNPQSLAAVSDCSVLKLDSGIRLAIKAYLLSVIAGGSTDAQIILNQAREAGWCDGKIPTNYLKWVNLYLLCSSLSPFITCNPSAIESSSKCFYELPKAYSEASQIELLALISGISPDSQNLSNLAISSGFYTAANTDKSGVLSAVSYLIYVISGSNKTVQQVVSGAACYEAFGTGQAEWVEVYLWCQYSIFFLNDMQQVYSLNVADPNAAGLTPDTPSKAAIFYQEPTTTASNMWFWSVGSQVWIQIIAP